jgi:hydroxymethylglutaryl-CoA lyase
MKSSALQITECPRDAMQGIKSWIPTEEKVAYLNQLLRVGFNRLDAGSFVSARAIPQMADTPQVFKQLDLSNTKTSILAIIANKRGAEEASAFEMVDYLGYPFSISETFQKRNTNAGIEESWSRLEEISEICFKQGKHLQVYLSMAFGNPYAEPWSPEIVYQWASRLAQSGIRHLALADTTGISDVSTISSLFSNLIPALPQLEISAHLHALPQDVGEKAMTAWNAGCRNFDTALKGFGGCPMADDELTGNMDTERMLAKLEASGIENDLNKEMLQRATEMAMELFNKYH